MLLRSVLFLHRWLGVLVGLLMTIWCLSGFVMMYVDYPRLSGAEQIKGLSPLNWDRVAGLNSLDISSDTGLSAARIEMMAGRPVLRIRPAMDPGKSVAQLQAIPSTFDLTSGRSFSGVSEADLATIAGTFGHQYGLDGPVAALAETQMDQWTVQTYRRNKPLYRVDYADTRGTQIYVSRASGEVVEDTTRFERFWGWLGAVPHWLYPTLLRQNGALWSEVVVYTSLIGCFLTVTGLWTGIARLRRKRDGSIGSPFQGVWWWHHIFGLFFGILTLTWVMSGLFSMNPWGFLDSAAGFEEQQQLAGPMNWGEMSASLDKIGALPRGTVRLEATPLHGRLHWIAIAADGAETRLDSAGRAAPLTRQELSAALDWAPRISSMALMKREDSYYYAHRYPAELPVWRVILGNAEQTRLYINAKTGGLERAFDGNGRRYRWLMTGLHDLDFPILRMRPLWDIVVVLLLASVTAVCGTGTWMGISKIRRDFRRLRLRRRRRRAVTAAAKG